VIKIKYLPKVSLSAKSETILVTYSFIIFTPE
jgi:hypothetical protein